MQIFVKSNYTKKSTEHKTSIAIDKITKKIQKSADISWRINLLLIFFGIFTLFLSQRSQRAEESHKEWHGEIGDEAMRYGEWHISTARGSGDDGQGGVGSGGPTGGYRRKRIHL